MSNMSAIETFWAMWVTMSLGFSRMVRMAAAARSICLVASSG